MAVVTGFEELGGENYKRHRTEVKAHYKVFGGGANGPLFQISTFGSGDRAIPGKVSQTVQFDRAAAEELWRLLDQTYGFSRSR